MAGKLIEGRKKSKTAAVCGCGQGEGSGTHTPERPPHLLFCPKLALPKGHSCPCYSPAQDHAWAPHCPQKRHQALTLAFTLPLIKIKPTSSSVSRLSPCLPMTPPPAALLAPTECLNFSPCPLSSPCPGTFLPFRDQLGIHHGPLKSHSPPPPSIRAPQTWLLLSACPTPVMARPPMRPTSQPLQALVNGPASGELSGGTPQYPWMKQPQPRSCPVLQDQRPPWPCLGLALSVSQERLDCTLPHPVAPGAQVERGQEPGQVGTRGAQRSAPGPGCTHREELAQRQLPAAHSPRARARLVARRQPQGPERHQRLQRRQVTMRGGPGTWDSRTCPG